MSRSRSFCLLIALATGCAGGPDAAPAQEQEGSPAAAPAAASPVEAVASEPVVVSVEELEGVWSRDDGRRYVLVADEGRLLGYDLDDDAFGCRLLLSPGEEAALQGQATFSRRADELRWLHAPWELQALSADSLEGRVEGVDLDDDDRELARSWETRRLTREARLDPEARDGWLALARFQRRLDATLLGDDFQALRELFTSPELAALEHVAGNQALVSRLQAVASRLTGPAAAPEASTVAASAAGGAPDMQGFLTHFDGTDVGVQAALDAYGEPGLERNEMDWYELRDPRVVGQESRDGLEWFRLEADAGMTVRTYELGWQGGQVVRVEFLGLR